MLRTVRVAHTGQRLDDDLQPHTDEGPCEPWPVDPACCPDWPQEPADWTAKHHLAAEIATDMLWRRSAGRYGLCEEVIRPCRLPCEPQGVGAFLQPYIDNGVWFNRRCGCTDGCHCGTLCAVNLPGPVHRVVEVKVDGQVVEDWQLMRGRGGVQLVRTGWVEPPITLDVRPDEDDPSGMTVIAVVDNFGQGTVDSLTFGDGTGQADVPEDTDIPHTYADPGRYTVTATDEVPPEPVEGGNQCWPSCQNLLLPDSEPDTFSVRYLRGKPVPAGGVRAVSTLACEIYKQCTGGKGCRLPDRVRTVTREGVTLDMFDPGEWLDQGLTGLREVDAWLRSVNPDALRQPPAVFSLDLPSAPVSTYRGAPTRPPFGGGR